jgi:hypothetical protein
MIVLGDGTLDLSLGLRSRSAQAGRSRHTRESCVASQLTSPSRDSRLGAVRRRACALLSVARSTIGYVSRLVARDAPVVPMLRTLAAQYPRYGYRTIRIFLERHATCSARIVCIACGARRACRCRGNGHGGGWR